MLEESVASPPSLWATMHSWFSPAVLFILLNVMICTIAITSSLTSNKTPEEEDPHNQTHEETNHTSKPQNLTKSPSMLQRLKSFNFYSKPQEEPTNPLYEQNPEINHLFSFPEPHEHEVEHEHVHAHVQYPQLGETREVEPEQEKDKPLSPRSPSILDKIKSFRLYSPMSPKPTSPKSNIAHFALDSDQEQEKEEEEEEEEEQDELEEEERSIEDEVYIQGQHSVSRTQSDTKPASGETLPKLSKKMRKSASEKSAFAHFEEEEHNVENRRPASVKEGKSKGGDVDEEVDAKADDFINRFKHQLKLQRMDSFTRYKEMINKGSDK